jgi:hypothetical protein
MSRPAAEVDEGTEVRPKTTPWDLARLQVVEEVLTLFLLCLFSQARGKHHVVAVLVELDDFGPERDRRKAAGTDPTELDKRTGEPRRPMSMIRPPDDLDDRRRRRPLP